MCATMFVRHSPGNVLVLLIAPIREIRVANLGWNWNLHRGHRLGQGASPMIVVASSFVANHLQPTSRIVFLFIRCATF